MDLKHGNRAHDAAGGQRRAGKTRDEQLRLPLLLAIAYGCSIGGMGTPIGTPPNVVFMGIYEEATGNTVSFLEWMSWALPIVVVLLPLAGLWITRHLRCHRRRGPATPAALAEC